MSNEISVSASDLGASSRAFPWPVLEAGNGSFTNGVYSVICTNEEPGQSVRLCHRVEEAPLLQRWIDSGWISFVCTVAAPRSMYRTLHASSVQAQLVRWQFVDLGEHPMFTPMLVAHDEIIHTVDAMMDGLNPIWDHRELLLPKGARVAVGPTFKFQSGIKGMLDFNLDESLNPGEFRVEDSSADGFKFKVHLATNLHQHLRYQRQDLVGGNIMVHIVSTALSILQRDYIQDDGEEGWRSFHNLVGLAELLEANELPRWDDEYFVPELAATRLYPHRVPEGGG